MTQNIKVQYYQAADVFGNKIYYTLEMQAESYMEALKFLHNIAETCKGIITDTSIILIDQNDKL